jgi:methionyl-tRNA synthetase
VIFEVIAAANRYVDAQAPWALRKTDPERMATVLFTLAETIRRIALLTQAFMPDASARILDQLAVPQDARVLRNYLDEASALRPGTPLPAPSGVFPRFAVEAVGAGR